MRKVTKHLISELCLGLFILLVSSAALGAKPFVSDGSGGYIWNGNNYPSGTHYNLNIHGKKAEFDCPLPEYEWVISNDSDPYELDNILPGSIVVGPLCPDLYTCSSRGDQVFGNVINVPRTPDSDINILMESGRKGPKSRPTTEILQVTDWCTKDFDGDDAVLRLPKDSEGYMVFARILGKPGDPAAQLGISGCLESVDDESGNELLMLGLVTTDGESFVPECPSYSDQITLRRYDEGKKGKGALKATDITQLFEWTGSVCYLTNTDEYCTDVSCDPWELCCLDANSDGAYEACEERGVNEDGTLAACPVTADEPPIAYEPVTAQCRSYEGEWVFNIGDFVEYMWGLDNTGAYNIKVRFYPLSKQEWWPLPEASP